MWAKNNAMIPNLLMNIRTVFITLMKIKNTIQIIKREILILFDDMISDIFHKKNLQPVVTELFSRARKLDISLVFIA